MDRACAECQNFLRLDEKFSFQCAMGLSERLKHAGQRLFPELFKCAAHRCKKLFLVLGRSGWSPQLFATTLHPVSATSHDARK